MRLEWSEPAIADRTAIYDHIGADHPKAAAELDRRFAEAAERLRQHPEIGRPGRIPGTREFVVHRRYIVLYQLARDSVQILAIVHTSRQWPPLGRHA